jgi:hypothetical protein
MKRLLRSELENLDLEGKVLTLCRDIYGEVNDTIISIRRIKKIGTSYYVIGFNVEIDIINLPLNMISEIYHLVNYDRFDFNRSILGKVNYIIENEELTY